MWSHISLLPWLINLALDKGKAQVVSRHRRQENDHKFTQSDPGRKIEARCTTFCTDTKICVYDVYACLCNYCCLCGVRALALSFIFGLFPRFVFWFRFVSFWFSFLLYFFFVFDMFRFRSVLVSFRFSCRPLFSSSRFCVLSFNFSFVFVSVRSVSC